MEDNKQIILSLRNIKDHLKMILTQGFVDESLFSDKEKMKEMLGSAIGTVHEVEASIGINIKEIIGSFDTINLKKKQVERMKAHSIAMGDFLNGGFTVLTGTPEEMIKQLETYIRHAEELWENSLAMFQQSNFSLACFLSIVCIEECSKISYGEFQFYHMILHQKKTIPTKPHGKNPLNQHNKKHFIAACSGVLVNTRLDGLVGVDKVTQFLNDCESGKLEKIRQSCIYADTNKDGTIAVPKAIITKEQAILYITIAGQLLSQIEGAESIRNGFQEKVDKFANEYYKKAKKI